MKDFLALGRFEGYQKKFVTSYIHCLVYHVPQQIRQYGNLLMFSGQGKITQAKIGVLYVLVITPLGGMLLVYRPDARGRVAPEGEGL